MTTKDTILQLAELIKTDVSSKKKQEIQDTAKPLFTKMYADKAKITEIKEWLDEYYPGHDRSDEGLAKYEELCNLFKETHGIWEWELKGVGVEWKVIDDSILSMKGTYITQNGSHETTLGEALKLFEM